MSTQPIHHASADHGDDPAAIHNALPERMRPDFLRAYRAAAMAAADDMDQYAALVELLRLWRLRASMYGERDYEERRAAAAAGPGIPIEDVVTDWAERTGRR